VTAVNLEASRQAVVEAALVLLERMGLTPADLAAVPQLRTPVLAHMLRAESVAALVDLTRTRPASAVIEQAKA